MVKRIFKSKKRVFWEALLITIAVFMMGMLSGVAFENSRLADMNEYYAKSEVNLMDSLAMKDILAGKGHNLSCEEAREYNVMFADKIYNESLKLSDYEQRNKITDQIKIAHQKYDMLRTFLWMNNRDLRGRCGDFSYVVYLYNYSSKDLGEKAENKVWSRILFDLKEKHGNDVVLIPIAANSDLISLEAMISEYNIEKYPVVIINDKKVISELESVEKLEKNIPFSG